MNPAFKFGLAAAAVLVVAVLGYNLLPRPVGPGLPGASETIAPTTAVSPAPIPTEEPTPTSRLVTFKPFGPGSILVMCPAPSADPDCVEDPRDDSITVTYILPAGWDEIGGAWIDENAPPAGAAVTVHRGSWLFSQPCKPQDVGDPDIRVGPAVDDFVTALVNHPLLDVTTPVDVTLAGYSGKYLELQVPDDISDCERYRPIDAHIYAQGPGHRWHMWVLDVGGVRVLIETNDYPGTPAARLAEEQSIIDSMVITP